MHDRTQTERKVPAFSDEFNEVEVRVDGWYGRVEISFRFPHNPPYHDVADLGFLAVCPDGFLFRMRIVADSVFVGSDPDAWGRSECGRLLEILRTDGEFQELTFRAVDGTPASDDGWVEKDKAGIDHCVLAVPDELAVVEDVASPRLADRIAGRYRTGPDWSTSNHLDACLSHPMFMVPVIRPCALALAAHRPWMLREVSPKAFEAMAVEASDPDVLVSPAHFAGRKFAPNRGWSEKAIACVDRFGPAPRGSYARNPDEQTVVLLGALPVDWHPRDEAEFLVATTFSEIVAGGWTYGREDIRLLMTGLKGRWAAFERSVVMDGGGRQPLRTQLDGIHDMIGHVARHLVHPLDPSGYDYVGDASRKTARRLLTRDGGLGLLARRSLRWHACWWRLPVLERAEHPEWPKLAADMDDGDMVLTFLNTQESLQEEGRAMEHCVASRVEACSMGWTHIAALRRKESDGSLGPSSTLEVCFERKGPDLVVRQHRGRANADPLPDETAFVGRWLEKANARAFPLDLTGEIPSRRRKRKTVFGLPPSGTPADWKGVLADEFVRMDWDGLVEAIRKIHHGMERRDATPFHWPSSDRTKTGAAA